MGYGERLTVPRDEPGKGRCRSEGEEGGKNVDMSQALKLCAKHAGDRQDLSLHSRRSGGTVLRVLAEDSLSSIMQKTYWKIRRGVEVHVTD